MIASGFKLQGYNFVGRPGLGTIGDILCWYDYRYGIATQSYSGTERVKTLQDLGPKSFNLVSIGSSADQNRPKVLTGGFGQNNVSPLAVSLVGTPGNALDIVHKGNPVFQLFVAKLDNTTGTGGPTSFSTLLSGKPGAQLRLIPSNRSLNFICFNDTGVNIRNYGTAVNSVPLNEFCVFAHLYYGAGTGSNNAKLWIKNSLTTFTSNPTHGTNASVTYSAFTTIGAAEFVAKMSISYDLTGKNTAQCDDFAALAFETLKNDPEYSSLTTP